MDYNRIDELLAKYWECETTLEEERELKTLLNDPSVPEKYRKEAALFGYFEKEQASGQLGELFEHRVMEAVHESEAAGISEDQGRIRRMWQDVVKVAAVVAILVTAVFVARDQYKENEENPEIAEARAAFEETKKALLMISASMNNGTEQAGKMAIFHEAQETIKSGDTEETTEEENTDNNE